MWCVGLLLMWCEPMRPAPAAACPRIEAWSADFQHRLANELRRQPDGSAILEEARQHLRLRDQIRRCKGAR